MNSVYNYMTTPQLDALNNAMLCGFFPTHDCMANRINWAYNDRTVNEVTSNAFTNGLFGEKAFIHHNEQLAHELRERIQNLESVIGSFKEELEGITLSIDAARTFANNIDIDVIQNISSVRKNELSSAEYLYYITIGSASENRSSPITASIYKAEIGNTRNIRFIKNLVEVPYADRNNLSDLIANHPEVKQMGIGIIVIPTYMHNRISQKPFHKHSNNFEIFYDLEFLEELS